MKRNWWHWFFTFMAVICGLALLGALLSHWWSSALFDAMFAGFWIWVRREEPRQQKVSR